jgi:hypothetical protein
VTRGSVRRRGQSWTVTYDETPDVAGRRRQRSRGGFRTRAEAQKFLNEQLTRVGNGSYAAPIKTTFGEFLVEEWLPAIESTVRPLTFTTYNSVTARGSCRGSAGCASRRSRAPT